MVMTEANAFTSRIEMDDIETQKEQIGERGSVGGDGMDTYHLRLCCNRKPCPSTGRKSWCWTLREQIAPLRKGETGSCVSVPVPRVRCIAKTHVNVSLYRLPAGSVRDGLAIDFCGCVGHDGWKIALLFPSVNWCIIARAWNCG